MPTAARHDYTISQHQEYWAPPPFRGNVRTSPLTPLRASFFVAILYVSRQLKAARMLHQVLCLKFTDLNTARKQPAILQPGDLQGAFWARFIRRDYAIERRGNSSVSFNPNRIYLFPNLYLRRDISHRIFTFYRQSGLTIDQ